MTMELFLKLRLNASHSLEEVETPHEHVWRIEAGFSGPVAEGRIVSLPALRARLEPIVDRLRGTHLNSHPELDPDSRAYPTCESLAIYLADKFQRTVREAGWDSIRLTQIQISVDEMDGEETGSARLTL